MIKGFPHVRTPDGRNEPITATKLACLRELAKCGLKGTCAVAGVMDGGTLAALVQFGLAERIPPDALGGQRYRLSAAGRKFLDSQECPA